MQILKAEKELNKMLKKLKPKILFFHKRFDSY